MSKSPAFQFYAAEYLADARVQMLSLAQEGIYIRLLSYCWREGSLPAEDAALRMLAKNCQAGMLAAVKALFTLAEDGSLIHGRLEQERAKQAEWRLKSSNGGKKGAEARAAIAASTTLQPPLQPPYQPNGNTAFASAFASSSATEDKDKNKQKPSRVKAASDLKPADPRFTPFKDAFFEHNRQTVQDEPSWGGRQAKALSDFLARTPKITQGQWQQVLDNRARSDIPQGQQLAKWIDDAQMYWKEPLDRFGKPKKDAIAGLEKPVQARDQLAELRAQREQAIREQEAELVGTCGENDSGSDVD